MFVETSINTGVSCPHYDQKDTSQKAKDKLKAEIHNGILDEYWCSQLSCCTTFFFFLPEC